MGAFRCGGCDAAGYGGNAWIATPRKQPKSAIENVDDESMSALSDLVVSEDNVAEAVFVRLQADATLKNAQHLNSTTAVWKESVAADAELPRVLISVSHFRPIDPNVPLYSFTVNLQTKMRARDSDKQLDGARMNRIDKRCTELMLGHGTLVLSGYRFFDAMFENSSGVFQPDGEEPEYTISTRFVVNCVRIA
jgi:hypothetical protein